MSKLHEQDVVTERDIPVTRLPMIAWLVLALVLAATAAWEWRMRELGLLAGDLDDNKSAWAVERRKVASGDHDGIVIVGGSRILFDTNLDVWEELTGRRPMQLAMPGVCSRAWLRTRTSPAWSSLTSRRNSFSAKAGRTRYSREFSSIGRTRGLRGEPATGSGSFSSTG
jgi:hypothetical protein